MANAIQEVDQEMLSTIKRHAGLGTALGIGIVIAGVLAVISPLVRQNKRPSPHIKKATDRWFCAIGGLRGPLGAPPSSGALSEGTVQERVQAAVAGLLEASSANEAMFRTYLKLSPESWLRDDEAGKLEYPRRQERRMEWLAAALADADTLTEPVLNKLTFALSMFMSIEALIVGAHMVSCVGFVTPDRQAKLGVATRSGLVDDPLKSVATRRIGAAIGIDRVALAALMTIALSRTGSADG